MISKLSCIVVDDEKNARENLMLLLSEFCPQVTIVGIASNVDDAVALIEKHQPKIVFLDIEMPEKNGFQLLNAFKTINFEIIFVTAYDHYAIKAFEVTAIDYLLKPIEVQRLQKAVKRAETFKGFKQDQLNALKLNKKRIQKLAIPCKNNYTIISVNSIACFKAERMYTKVYTCSNEEYLLSKKMSFYENLLSENDNFIRVHRSWIINTHHLLYYSKKERELDLLGNYKIPISKNYKEFFEGIII